MLVPLQREPIQRRLVCHRQIDQLVRRVHKHLAVVGYFLAVVSHVYASVVLDDVAAGAGRTLGRREFYPVHVDNGSGFQAQSEGRRDVSGGRLVA